MKRIGIVLVNFCGAEDTIECINSIRNANLILPIDIVIVDNASSQNGIERIINGLQLFEGCHFNFNSISGVKFHDNMVDYIFLQSPKNGGFGYGNNIGLRYLKESNESVCILLNNDTVVCKDFFVKIRDYLNGRNEKVAFSILSRYYTHFNRIDSEGFGYFDMYTGRSSHKYHYNIKYLVGSCIIMNNIASIPYFDENFFLYCEDIDYTFSLVDNQYSIEYDPQNYFLHKVNSSTSSNPNMEKIKMLSMIYLMRKRGTTTQFIAFFLTRFIYYMCNFRFSYLTYFCKNVWK